MSDSTTSFGAVLRRLRSERSLSQEELAERAGISRRSISDLERGARHAPYLATVRRLTDALQLDDDSRAVLLAAARPAVMATVPAGRGHSRPVASLPLPPTRLIGREAEVATLSALLTQRDVRLVTLTGAGGTGKTHLALVVAAGVAHHFAYGACFVDLSPLTDPTLVLPAIATALGVVETADMRLRETLSRNLRARRLLLVLDNCEQILAAAADVAALLAECPHLVILATSRVPWHLRAEREFPLSPLSLPPADPPLIIAEVARVPAVTLFVERATASQPVFALTAENAAATVAICRRLDGLPLAIELAAARIKFLSPTALLARLEHRLPLLTGGARDAPSRHGTMRDTIGWSYDLLSPAEQTLFRRLSVFAGGFTLAAAEYVGGEGGGTTLRGSAPLRGKEVEDEFRRSPSSPLFPEAARRPAPPERGGALLVLDGVIALVDQSLLRQITGAGDESRYQMFETVREFGLEQLTATGEAEDARQRHADYFVSIAENLQHGIRMTENLTGLAPERDNVLLALTWFDEHGDAEALLWLSQLLYGIWLAPGYYREGLRWIDRALNRASTMASPPRVWALGAAGNLALFRGDYARAATYVTESLTLARVLGDPLLVGGALYNAGLLSYRRGEYGQAEELLSEAHRLLHGLVDSVPDAVWDTGLALLVLGDTALAQEQFARAARWYEESLELIKTGGDLWEPTDARAGLAAVKYCTGDFVRAAALYVESLGHAWHHGVALLVASALLGLAGVAAASGQPETGAYLLGGAEGILASLAAPIFPRDQPVRERGLAAMKEALGEDQLALALEAGRALPVDEAVAHAMALGEAVMRSPP